MYSLVELLKTHFDPFFKTNITEAHMYLYGSSSEVSLIVSDLKWANTMKHKVLHCCSHLTSAAPHVSKDTEPPV